MSKTQLRTAFEGMSSGFKAEVKRLARMDNWINAITGLGGARDKTTAATIADFTALSPAELEALYHGNDLAAKLVGKLPREALRQGFSVGDPDLDDLHKVWKTKNLVLEAAIWGRLYGVGAILIGTADALMDTPLDVAAITPGSLRYLTVLDRQSLTIETYNEDPSSPDFGLPDMYRVKQSLVHASRLVIFGGALTAERVRMRKNAGFDLSILQRPQLILRDTDQTWRSMMLLLQDMSQAVFAVDGLIDMIAEGEKDTMLARMEVVDMARSVARAVVIDAENETFEHKGAVNVSGIQPAMMLTFQRLAASADMPMTALIGMSPAGMNATGESDTRAWYDTIQSNRDDDLTPALVRLTQVLAAHGGFTLDAEPVIEWPSLWQMTPVEEATHEKTEAEADAIRINSGVLEPEEVTLAKFESRPRYADVIDFDARRASLRPDPGTLDISGNTDVQKASLNGAQIKALQGVIDSVVSGTLPRDSGIQLIVAAFPINEATANKIMGSVGRGFHPDAPPQA